MIISWRWTCIKNICWLAFPAFTALAFCVLFCFNAWSGQLYSFEMVLCTSVHCSVRYTALWWIQRAETLIRHSQHWCRWSTRCRFITARPFTSWWRTCAECAGCRWRLVIRSRCPASVSSSVTSSFDRRGKTSCECWSFHSWAKMLEIISCRFARF